MLDELTISSLGVIADATLELGPGLNVVTGETGAGKTMVVTALGLLLGDRADPGTVRSDADRARVHGLVRVDSLPGVAGRALEAGADIDDGALIVARVVRREGRSQANVGGAAVPLATLGALTAELVVVHGQSEQRELLSPVRQRRTLDDFGDHDHRQLLASYGATYQELQDVGAELCRVVSQARARAREADLLRFGLTEIEAARPQPGEDSELAAEEARLAHVDGLRAAAEQARAALSADLPDPDQHDVLGLVAEARKSLEGEREHDQELSELADRLAAASYQVVDVAADLAAYVGGLDTDPARLAVVQDRRATLATLTRKYGDTQAIESAGATEHAPSEGVEAGSVDAVLVWSRRAVERLTLLDDDDARVAALTDRRDELAAAVLARGERLRESRHTLGQALAAQVTSELHDLAMPDASFEVEIIAKDTPSADGLDEIGFVFSAHPGGSLRPLQRGASGGELSRVMLALEVCLAGTRAVPTMVFDEVDAGVGGRAAVEVGRRLARLSRVVQVIVVTHLPQVAAFADRHYVVVKSSDGSVTTSGVTRLDDAGRRRELSRMLAGLEDSDTALAHADELVELARGERRN